MFQMIKLCFDNQQNKQLFAYSYSVNSPSNGDIKSHSESRNGKTVTGEYSIVQPDGKMFETYQYQYQ